MKKTKVYSTYKDNQARVDVRVVQGERRFAKNNKELGLFVLDKLAPAPAGIPQIEVTFDVDSNGILTVSAKDQATQKEQTVTITGTSTLAPEDIEEKVEQARATAAEEARQQAVQAVKNDAESIAFALERVLRERKDKVKKSKAEVIESKVMLIREEVARPQLDVDLIRTITEDLEDELKAILLQKEREEYDVSQGFSLPTEVEEVARDEVQKKRTPL